MPIDSPNVGVAFGLVIGAGLATSLGASVVFFPSFVKMASKRVLASALGISAGVMSYVSFVEIFAKSTDSFIEAGYDEGTAYAYSTLCFFGGVIAMLLLNFLVKILSKGQHHHHHEIPDPDISKESLEEEAEVVAPHCVGCSSDPAAELDEWQHMAEEEERRKQDDATGGTAGDDIGAGEGKKRGESIESDRFDENKSDNNGSAVDAEGGLGLTSPSEKGRNENISVVLESDEAKAARRESKKLINMGVNTALAIGLHNFPEGLATFVAALNDPKVGAVLAIAIGIHNIPEGLCVSLPIYYATGNRWKAFLWACVSGISEPIAALLGWAILANSFTPITYAVLFGMVGGMMVIISARELLPTAHRYDPEDTVVTYSFIVGMVIMALSLVLFVI